ncbi:MAG: TRAP transporter substrate-binding protein [Synergistetes bacterium]|nr:TRAP transporter substrate-binding protein [Synergistota bacterium]
MRRSLLVTAVVVMVLLGLALPLISQEKTVRVVGSWGNLALHKKFERPLWTEVLPQAFGGKLKPVLTTLEQVKLSGAEVLRAMDKGVFDVVSTVVDYVVSDAPELAGLDLPAIAPDIGTARKVVEAYKPVMAGVLEKTFNAKLLAVVPYPAQVLFSKIEIKGLADLKGKKVRASGWTTSQFVEALGATGVTITFSEVATALQRGVVDCAVTGSLSGYSAGWGEVSKYLYPLPIGGWDYVMTVMRLDVWNSFSPEERKTIESLMKEKYENPAWDDADDQTRQGINCLTGKGDCQYGKPNSMQLIEVTPTDIELARKLLLEHVLPAWAKQAGEDAVKRWNESIGKVIGLKAEIKK